MSRGEATLTIVLALIGFGFAAGQDFRLNVGSLASWALAAIIVVAHLLHREPDSRISSLGPLDTPARPLRLELPDGTRAFHVCVGSFDVEEWGEEDDGTPRFNYGEGHEVWRARITNISPTTLHAVHVSVTALSPLPISPTVGQSVEAMLPFVMVTFPILPAGDSRTFDVLDHHHGSPFVSLVGTHPPSFYAYDQGTVMELRVFAEEEIPVTTGRIEIRAQGPHHAVTVSALP